MFEIAKKHFKIFAIPCFRSFSSKIQLTQVISVVIISLSFTAFFIHYQKKSRTDLLINKGELLAEKVAENARIGVFAENQELLSDCLVSVMGQEEVLGVDIYTGDGRLLARKWRRLGTKWLDPVDGETKRKMIEQLRLTSKTSYIERVRSINFWTAIRSDTKNNRMEGFFLPDIPARIQSTIGFVSLTIGKRQLLQSFQTILLDSALITAALLISVLVVTCLIITSITRPLKRLKESAEALGTGEAIEEIPVETDDEVGKLAAAFNSMTQSLKIRELEKAQLTEQLLHAQKMEAVGTLAGGLAHDFNNMLTAIAGYGALLRDELEDDGPGSTYVSEILYAADKATTLTRRLLTFSRKQPINPVTMNLNIAILDINKLLLRFLNEKIDLRLELTPEDLFVKADQVHIEQVLINLVTNARDAMPTGGVLVIRTSLLEGGDGTTGAGYARLSVSDTGTGISSSIKARIFDPFFTTKEVGKGTGLGLSIVYGIIKQHNGSIEVDTSPAKGTSIHIHLPLTERTESAEKETDSLTTGGNETVLLAEDDFTVRMLGKHLLAKCGYHVIEAEDGQDAVEKFLANRDVIQVLLLDVVMPKKNGRQVYEEISKIRPDIKALFMSGYPRDIMGNHDLVEEGFNFITKPLHTVELLAKLRAVIAGETQRVPPFA